MFISEEKSDFDLKESKYAMINPIMDILET
jgi:hypothetical protein